MKRWKERLVACVLLLGFLGAGLVLVPQQPARPAWVQEWLASQPVHSFEGVTLAHKPATALAAAAPREAAPHRLAVLVEAAVIHAAQQPPQPAPQVRLPATPPAPQPPQPVPGAATKLAANQWYIIDSDLALVVLTSPPGLVGVGKEGGPIKLRGWFVDAVGVETRTYGGKFIYCLDATGVGKVELLIIRSDNQEVIRRWLDVDNGGPAPPPGPGPGPDAFTQSILDAYAKEADTKKLQYVKSYASLYRSAATLIVAKDDKGNWVRGDIQTYGDLFGWLKAAEPALGLPGNIPLIRAIVSGEMLAAFGKTTTTPVDRSLVQRELNKIADALSAIK